MALPNLWEICGLRSSPYFQDALEENSDTKSVILDKLAQKTADLRILSVILVVPR